MATEKNILILEEFKATSFAGISQDKPVVIDFTKMRKNPKVIEFFGDQGTRKTSSLLGVIYAMGGRFKLKKEQLLNSKDKKLEVSLKFQYEGESYLVEADETRVVVKKLQEGGKWKEDKTDTPTNLLKQMFGPVGLSPFAVRELGGKKQIEYFQQLFGSGDDANKKMITLENQIDNDFNSRTLVNRDATLLKGALETEPLYNDREGSESKFSKPIDSEKERAIYKGISDKKNGYLQYENTLNITISDLSDQDRNIKELEDKLLAAKQKRDKTNESVEKGKKWMETNKSILKEFEVADKEWTNLSKKLADYEQWKQIVVKEKQYNELIEQSITLTGKIDDGRLKLLKLTNSIVPKVEGFSLKVSAGVDKTTQQEGAFYKVPGKKNAVDQPIHELSQSEYEAMWAEIFAAADIPFLFFENLNNFGSQTINLLTRLSKEKDVVIFGTRTDPNVKEMGVEFKAKL